MARFSTLLSFVVSALWLFLPASCIGVGQDDQGEPMKEAAGETAQAVTFGTLLDSMTDMEALARLPVPSFTTRQFSSYDRSSRSPGEAGWFANSDGFGREAIPGFEKVLREPGEDGVGLYLMASSQGPGAMVRTWSAWINGTIRVYLDDAEVPFFEGPAADFLVRKAERLLEKGKVDLKCGDAFRQQDADYLPIPYGRSLKVTWEGKIQDTHFYHLEVIEFVEGTPVATFTEQDLHDYSENLQQAVARLTDPPPCAAGSRIEVGEETIVPGALWKWTTPGGEETAGGAIAELTLNLEGAAREEALRGALLTIRFDGASHPQVEAPVGDFFGSGPGVNVYNSVPFRVAPDGTMTCRFVMPYRRQAEISLRNTTQQTLTLRGAVTVAPWTWDDRSLYFRARWRSDNNLHLMKRQVIDMPFVVLRGTGHLVGAAVMVVNPSAAPTPAGNWWGEGDEKIFVDDEETACFFGTGSEDYFNYSWSRPDLFDHPYCGQPLDSGPGNLGYVSNHRWHLIDPIPFERALAFYMELYHHSPFPDMSYSRIAYLYARPGALDDHRGLLSSDLKVQPVRSNEPQAYGGASNSTFHFFEDLGPAVTGGFISNVEHRSGAARGRLIEWRAEKDDRLRLFLPCAEDGNRMVSLVTTHRPDGGSFRAEINGTALKVRNRGGGEGENLDPGIVAARSSHANRLLSTSFEPLKLKAGTFELVLVCTGAGTVGFDYLWVKKM